MAELETIKRSSVRVRQEITLTISVRLPHVAVKLLLLLMPHQRSSLESRKGGVC